MLTAAVTADNGTNVATGARLRFPANETVDSATWMPKRRPRHRQDAEAVAVLLLSASADRLPIQANPQRNVRTERRACVV
jgi:hypothetical protein